MILNKLVNVSLDPATKRMSLLTTAVAQGDLCCGSAEVDTWQDEEGQRRSRNGMGNAHRLPMSLAPSPLPATTPKMVGLYITRNGAQGMIF